MGLRISLRTLAVFIGFVLTITFLTRSRGDNELLPAIPASSKPHFPLNTTLYYPPFHTKGRDIIDDRNQIVKLASVNWYGASDELFIPGGLDIRHRDDIAATISSMGFNSVRLPYSDEMVVSNPLIPRIIVSANPDLAGLPALEVYEAVVEALTDAGIFVIPNNHITHSTWCCGINPCDASWKNSHLGPVCRIYQTEEQWIENWLTIMRPHTSNPLVIGADLRNEPRGLWGTMKWDSWAEAAENAGNELLELNEDWLIIVEGTSSSNDLVCVAGRPIELIVDHRVVYSTHIYSWSGWGSFGGTYNHRTYASFSAAMLTNWAYLLTQNLAPVWVGEFGSPHLVGKDDKNYWNNLVRFLREVNADFGYWALNPRKPHGNEESYGLLGDDWETVVWDYRMSDMVRLMDLQRA